MNKPIRITDDALLEMFRSYPCLCCGVQGETDVHHIKTKGSGGPDWPTNLMPLCRVHHTEVHNSGLAKFSFKYPRVEVYLSDIGWEFDGNRWISPDFQSL